MDRCGNGKGRAHENLSFGILNTDTNQFESVGSVEGGRGGKIWGVGRERD